MQELAVWQWAAIMASAAIGVGVMAWACWRLTSRRSQGRGVERPGDALESSAYGANAPDGTLVFDAWSYRVGARFAGRVRIVIGPDKVVVCGPRVPGNLYDLWIWAQALLLGLVPAALVWAAVALDWRGLLAALAWFVASWAVSMLGAATWPALGELPGVQSGSFPALQMPRALIHGASVGAGWSDGGLGVVLLPYSAGIDALSAGRAVSFWGPDERGREVRFALHCYSDETAETLAGLIG